MGAVLLRLLWGRRGIYDSLSLAESGLGESGRADKQKQTSEKDLFHILSAFPQNYPIFPFLLW